MADNRNTILAIVLSLIVLLGWQYFVAQPQIERQREAARGHVGREPHPALTVVYDLLRLVQRRAALDPWDPSIQTWQHTCAWI